MRLSARCPIVIFLLLLTIDNGAYAAPDVVEHYRYYDVTGHNPNTIRQSMNERRRKHVRGGHDAYVSWFLSWRFSYDDDLNGCKIETVSSSLKVNYILPRWIGEEQSSLGTNARWKKYYDALLAHEHGHRDWGVSAANAIEKKLKTIPYERDCLLLRTKAQRFASRILADHLRQEKHYDRATQHGAAQGAVFP